MKSQDFARMGGMQFNLITYFLNYTVYTIPFLSKKLNNK